MYRQEIDLNDRYLRVLSDPWYRTLANIQDVISTSTYKFFAGRGLKTLHLPITTHSISSPQGRGSDSLPVQVNLFGVDTYLADSMQFMLEYGYRLHRSGCYYLMPSFRGENADESHLCQFYHSEAEIIGSLEDVMSLIEEYVRVMTEQILIECGPALHELVGNVSHLETLLASQASFPRLTLDEAEKLLGTSDNYIQVVGGQYRVLTRLGEQALIKHCGGFVWLTEPDHLAVPFYQAFADSEGKQAKAADLLFGIGEVVGSGERHTSADDIHRAMTLHEVNPEPYLWYCKMRECFPLRTSGFGLGTERYICWVLQHTDIRDCQVLVRSNGIASIP